MKEFQAVFQIDRCTIFEVRYYTLGNNNCPHFTTSAAHFIRSKRDFDHCGQAQKSLLPRCSAAFRFFNKWDALHLSDLTPEQYAEIVNELEQLKDRYNYLYEELDPEKRPYHPSFNFYRLVEFTKQTPKRS